MATLKTKLPGTAPVSPAQAKNANILSASSAALLTNYSPMQKQPQERKAQIAENKTVTAISASFSSFMEDELSARQLTYYNVDEGAPEAYSLALHHAKKLKYSAQDVHLFSLALADFQEHPEFEGAAGIFLSALINNSTEQNFTIQTSHLSVNLNFLGFANCKNLTIEGDTGYLFGAFMSKGKLSASGNAGAGAGLGMKGGELCIAGNAGNEAGTEMKGGMLLIGGSAGEATGSRMERGKIRIMGDVEDDAGIGMYGGELLIEGNAGNKLGAGMRNGRIKVQGNAGEDVGKYIDSEAIPDSIPTIRIGGTYVSLAPTLVSWITIYCNHKCIVKEGTPWT